MARHSVTQTDLAPQIGLSVRQLRRRLYGESPLTVSELLTIADALHVPPATLVDCSRTKTTPGRVNGQGSRTEPLLSKGAGQ